MFSFYFFIFFVLIRVNNDSNEAERIFLLKYQEHTGDTLALCCRRRTWVAAISYGELHQALIRRFPNGETLSVEGRKSMTEYIGHAKRTG